VEALERIAEGNPNQRGAAEPGVSFKTVDEHRQKLMRKLNIHDVAGRHHSLKKSSRAAG